MTRINTEQIAEQSEFVRLMSEAGFYCSSFEYHRDGIMVDAEFTLELYTKQSTHRVGRWIGTLNDARRLAALFPQAQK